MELVLSDIDYKHSFEILGSTSNHISKTLKIVEENVIPNLIRKDNWLDVGAGPATLTRLIKPYFLRYKYCNCNLIGLALQLSRNLPRWYQATKMITLKFFNKMLLI